MTSEPTPKMQVVDADGDVPPDEQDDAIIGKAFRWSLVVLVVLGAVAGGAIWWFNRDAAPPPTKQTRLEQPKRREQAKVDPPSVAFTDVTRDAGIDFVHVNGAYGQKLLPETMGGGCAFFDFDNDGDQDLLLVNSRNWPWSPNKGNRATCALYRNDSGGGGVRFTDVTAGSGLDVELYGLGAAVGDYDNDGRVDVFITCVGDPTQGLPGGNRLFRNMGGGRFTDVTADAGVVGADDSWSTSAAFFDADNDGDLDLFVCNYVKWSKKIDAKQGFTLVGVGRAYGPPTAFEGAFSYLYRNEGGGRFTDVSKAAGIQVVNAVTGVPLGKALGVVPADVDRDGDLDLVVANDTVQNFLFRNRGDGTFEESGAAMGVAFDANGMARGAMGIDAGHFRNDDSVGVAIGNFSNEMTALYVGQRIPSSVPGAGPNTVLFTDDAVSTGLGPPTRLELTFGLFFFDYDLDGRLDVLGANGHLEDDIHKVLSSQHYRQPARLLWNAGAGQGSEFVAVPADKTGADFVEPIVGRGAAYADIDGDGDLDVLLTQVAGPPRLLRNDQQLRHHFVRLKLVGSPAARVNRDAIGAQVEVVVGSAVVRRQVMPARSYLSQVELPVTIGLGERTTADRVTVRWPNGAVQVVKDAPIDREHVVRQAPTGR